MPTAAMIKRDDTEAGHEHEREPGLRERVADVCRHRLRAIDGRLGVHRCDHLADRRGQRRRIDCRANHDEGLGAAEPDQWPEDLWPHRAREILAADVLDDADHLGERILRSGRLRLQSFADRVFTWPRARGERLVDDDDVGAAVALFEEAAGEQPRAERAEVVRGRAAAVGGCALPVAGSRLVVRKRRQGAAAGEWQLRRDARHASRPAACGSPPPSGG